MEYCKDLTLWLVIVLTLPIMYCYLGQPQLIIVFTTTLHSALDGKEDVKARCYVFYCLFVTCLALGLPALPVMKQKSHW